MYKILFFNLCMTPKSKTHILFHCQFWCLWQLTSLETERFGPRDAVTKHSHRKLSPREVLSRSTHPCRQETLNKERLTLALLVQVAYHIMKCLAFKMRKEVNT